MKPQARTQGLVVQEMGDETLVYDLERHRAHCLNGALAAVWLACDGLATVDEIAARLKRESDAPAARETVWLALRQLERAHLLEEPLPRAARSPAISRRRLIQKIGVGALSVPLLTSLSAPTWAAAASLPCTSSPCVTDCQRCGNNADQCGKKVCRSGNCVDKTSTTCP